jgi:hypothetical protein
MDATWYNYDKFLKQRNRPDKDLLLILEQMLYDLTLWFAMANDKHTRYDNAHVRAFIAAFGLAEPEPGDADAEFSTDDEARPASPPLQF